MAASVYTNARLRRNPFFIRIHFSGIPLRVAVHSAAKYSVISSPSSHDALWKQVGAMRNAMKWAADVLGRVD